MPVIFSEESINFGDLAGEIDAVLQQGITARRHHTARTNRIFR